MVSDRTADNAIAKIPCTLDEFSYLFDGRERKDLVQLKNEINSLRGHYVHEGYYFNDNKFKVTRDDKSTYEKEIDYDWLYRITRALKLSAYIILYKEVLGLDVNESELRMSI